MYPLPIRERKIPVLHDIDFTARPGETTAIIGSTGCGKSTVVNLIPRFYDVTEGEILVDGVDVRKISQRTLHSKLGYVPPERRPFSGTIASNIAYSNDAMSDADIRKAADIARPAISSRKKRSSTILRSPRAVPTFQVARSSVSPLPAPSPESRRFTFLMTASLLWTIRLMRPFERP